MIRRPPRALALAYHGVSAVSPRRDPHGLFVSPEHLRRHIAFLRRRGYDLVTFGELVARDVGGAGAGHAALTFDDALADNVDVLLPLLADLAVPATVFAVSGWLGGEHPDAPGARLADAAGLRRLHAAGVEIGGHTAQHRDLTTLSLDAARRELETGRRALEEIIDAPVTSAAYPYGHATADTVRACGEAGFAAAARTAGQGARDRPLDYPRQDMTNGASLTGLALKAAGLYEPLMRRRPARMLRHARTSARQRLG